MTRAPSPAASAVATARAGRPDRLEDPRHPEKRLRAFLDDGSVELLGPDDGSGMMAARGTLDGQRVVAFVSDATIMGGAMGVDGCRVVIDAYELALAESLPIIGLWHSGGARLPEGVVSLHAVGEIFAIMTRASGKIPQISVVLGAAAGGAAYGPALTDIVILAPEGRIFVTGPDVVRSVTGEAVDALRLGGPEPHGRRSGVVHVLAVSLEDAFDRARAITRLLDPATQGGEALIGRVVIAPEARGSGLGHQLMERAVAACLERWPGLPIYLSAQAHLQGYYGRYGFVAVTEPYLEDDIPHIGMRRQPQ